MIDFLSGNIEYIGEDYIVLSVSGVGFKVLTSTSSINNAWKIGENARFFTEMVVREDAIFLVGFSDRIELELYKLLVSVNGVGPKAALSILSAFTVSTLQSAINDGDSKLIARAHGIGKKTSERIILELGGKLPRFESEGAEVVSNTHSDNDAHLALVSLGYSRDEATNALKGLEGSTEMLIKQALSRLMRG